LDAGHFFWTRPDPHTLTQPDPTYGLELMSDL